MCCYCVANYEETMQAGCGGVEVVVLHKEYVLKELLADLVFAARFFRDLAMVSFQMSARSRSLLPL